MPHDDGADYERCESCHRLDPASCPCPPEETTVTIYPTGEDVPMALATAETGDVLIDVADERVRQVAKWGVQTRPDGTGAMVYATAAKLAKEHTDRRAEDGSLTWLDILMEEVFEALAERDPEALRTELVQVAAVATSWVEDIDRKQAAHDAALTAKQAALIDAAISEGRLPLRSPVDAALPNGTPADDIHHLVNEDARSAWRNDDGEDDPR